MALLESVIQLKFSRTWTVIKLMFRSLKLAGPLIVLSSALEAAPEGHLFFEEKVRPILAEHCLKCHSEEKKIKGGLLLDRKAGWEKRSEEHTSELQSH
jgi:hypothetical protein